MNYENAKDWLPEELLKQVQRYAGGKLLYIPVGSESKSWGEVSGYRQKLLKRNVMIQNKYRNGKTLSELSDEYYLSLDSLRKIIYCKKDKDLEYAPSVTSAVSYAEMGLTEEWLKTYYQTMNHKEYENEPENSISVGILKIPLRLIEFKEPENQYEVLTPAENEEEPLIVHYEQNRFSVHLQKALLVELKSRRINAYPAFIIVQNKEEYQSFMKLYGRHFLNVGRK